MPTADLRALAERLRMLKPCECRMRFHDNCGCITAESCPWCGDTGKRLPEEAEVRAAIFEAKFGVTVYAGPENATVVLSGRHVSYATRGEALPNQHVLLALLRALEAAVGKQEKPGGICGWPVDDDLDDIQQHRRTRWLGVQGARRRDG